MKNVNRGCSQTSTMGRRALQAMVDEATIDAYDESEQVMGLFTMLEENLALPFQTEILGTRAMVGSIELDNDDRIQAVCTRSGKRQKISLLHLAIPASPPRGADWIMAYRYWAGAVE